MRYLIATMFAMAGCGGVAESTGASSEAYSTGCNYDEAGFPAPLESATRTAFSPNCNGRYLLQIDNTLGATGTIAAADIDGFGGTCGTTIDGKLYGWDPASGWKLVNAYTTTNFAAGLPCPSLSFDLASGFSLGGRGPAPNNFGTLLLSVSTGNAWGGVGVTMTHFANTIHRRWW